MLGSGEIVSQLEDRVNTARFGRLLQNEDDGTTTAETNTAISHPVEHGRDRCEHPDSLALVGQLPGELLSFIFKCHVFWASSSVNRYFLAFSQVCRRWRVTAVEDPSLWTKPIFDCPDLGELMIGRAQTPPLIVTADSSSVTTRYHVLQLAFGQHSQFAELDLKVKAKQARQLMVQINDTMSFLTKLKLRTTSPVYLRNNRLKCVRFPCLRELYLKRCTFAPNAQCVRNLTRLEIHLRPSDSTRMNVRRLIVILSRNPGLESLVLVHVTRTPDLDAPLVPPTDKLQLRHLEEIDLHGDLDSIASIFWNFETPKLRCLHLSNDKEQGEQDMESFVVLFERLKAWREMLEDEIRYLMFRIGSRGIVQCEADYDETPEETKPIQIIIRGSDENQEDLVRLTTSLFDPSSVVTLGASWCGPQLVSRSPVLDFIMSGPRIRTLQLLDFAIVGFCVKAVSDIAEGHHPLPSMERLEVTNALMYTQVCTAKHTMIHNLARALRALKSRGTPLSRLSLTRPLCRTDPREAFDQLEVDLDIHDAIVVADGCTGNAQLERYMSDLLIKGSMVFRDEGKDSEDDDAADEEQVSEEDGDDDSQYDSEDSADNE